MQLNWKLRLLASQVDIMNIFRRGHLILKLLSFEKKIVNIQALLRHNEYTKTDYKKKLRYLKKTFARTLWRDCSLQCLNGRHFITSWNFIVKF